MDVTSFINEVSTQLVVAIITFVFGFLISKIPGSLDKYRLRRLLGPDIFSDKFRIVYGMLSRVPDTSLAGVSVYEKFHSNGTRFSLTPPRYVITPDVVRGLSYFLQEFSRHRKKPFLICTDTEALSHLHDETLFSVGGPLANELSDVILKDENNTFVKFAILQAKPGGMAVIEIVNGNARFERTEEKGHDYGIIVKVRNGRSTSKKYCFVCAGIGPLGTSAALWYLSSHWKQLYREFGSGEFGVVVEAMREQDNVAKRVELSTEPDNKPESVLR